MQSAAIKKQKQLTHGPSHHCQDSKTPFPSQAVTRVLPVQLRSLLAVPYFEKALYELPEQQLNPQTLQALADDTERRIQGGLSPRPLLSVPHILADESSCYCHGWVERNGVTKPAGHVFSTP